MLLKATRPAAYSVFPLASSFQTMTMAMQRARPIMISPTMYSGLSGRKTTASMNISTGPISQFCTSDSPRIFLLWKTSGISSYFTLAKGGYIIRIRPTAMGMLVVPTWKRLMNCFHSGDEAAQAHSQRHGGKDPEGQPAVEKGELAPDMVTHDMLP